LKFTRLRTLSIYSAAVLSTQAWAQPSQPDEAGAEYALEEIVVTAERQEEDLQETAISMLAVSAQALTAANIQQFQDLTFVLPQLQIQPHPNSASTLSLYLRGVGNSDEQILQDPSVGVYVDGVYLPRNQGLNLDLLEIERIEMLRGPQGTLYGRNATGGAINIITSAPDDSLSGRVTQGLGNYGHRRTVATLSMPLARNLAARVSHGQLHQDGFVDNPPGASASFGELARETQRFDLAWSPHPAVAARYTFDRQAADDMPAYIAAVPLFPGTAPRPDMAVAGVADLRNNFVDSSGHTLTVDWQLSERWLVKSISATRALADSQVQTYHQGVFSASSLLVTNARGEQTMRSQELQISGRLRSNVEILGGLYLFREEASRNAGNLTPANNRRSLVMSRGIQNQSAAVFARASWTPDALASRLTLTAGLRLSEDQRVAALQRGVEDVARGVISLNPQLYSGERRFRNASPEIVAEYALDQSRFLYAKASRGYKSGGFNARASSVQRFSEGFDDEQLLSTELGFKSEWLERRLRVNAALFYGDYRDIQLNVQSDPDNILLSDVLNAGGAAISGLELDVQWLVRPWLQLALSCSQLRANLYDVRNARNANVAANYRIIGAPEQSCASSVNLSRQLSPGVTFFGTLAHRFQSDTFGSATTAAGEYRIPAYDVVNLQAGITFTMKNATLQMTSWMRNAADEEYYLSHFNGGAGRIVPSAFYGASRTAGIDLTLNYR